MGGVDKADDSTVTVASKDSAVSVKATSNDEATSEIPQKSTPDTFATINGNTYYYGENGNLYRNQFYNNWGHTYYFGSDGARWDNRFYNNWGRTYYFGDDGARWDNRFYNNWGHTYYFGSDGARWDNQFYNNWGNTYYFGDDGARWDNRYMVKWGNAYYFGNDGALAKNQNISVNGTRYWADNQGIIPLKNQFLTANNNQLYYFDSNGSLITDKFYHNWGHTYYFGSDGARYTDQFLNKNGKVYYFDSQGIMYQDQYYKNWGHTYYFGNDGARYTNQFMNKGGKQYYFDDQGIMLTNQDRIIDGKFYHFNVNGEATQVNDPSEIRNTVAKQVATALNNENVQNIEYDWQSKDHNYRELALHDLAQEVAQGDTKADKAIIADKLKKNSLLTGNVLSVFTTNFNNVDLSTLVQRFINSFNPADANNSVLGVGADANKDQLAIVLFKPGQETVSQKVSSPVNATISTVYPAAGSNVTVKNAIKDNDNLSNADVKDGVTQFSSELLQGKQGTRISDDVLKAIFAGLAGNEYALDGAKNYYADNGDAYHYEFWLAGKDATEKLNNFLTANNGVKYGDPIKVTYTATLTWGAAKSTANDKTPASQKTAEELNLAYKTGTDTGLRYDSVTVEKIPNMSDDMIRGVDISSYQSLINAGVKFYDFNGQEASLFKVLKDAGVNWIRLRLWNDPYNAEGLGYGGGNNDEESLVKMASEASQYGMKILVDFHYSDFWADPAKQPLPKAWKNLSSADLTKEISLYTSKVLNDLKQAGADVEMVQVGNEVTNGAFGIWTDRDHGGNWATTWESDQGNQVAKYLGTASAAVRSVLPNAKIAIQLETPNISKYRSIMTVLKNNNVDYDYLGTSYYPFWSTHDGNSWYDNIDLGYGASTPINLEAIEKMAWREFGKKTVVLETGWINNVNDADGTGNSISANDEIQAYSHDPQGQVNAIEDMYKALVAQGGVGGFYWEPAWIPDKAGWQNWDYNKKMSDIYGTGWASKNAVGYAPDSVMYYNGQPTWGGTTWDNVALFDDQGHPLQSLNVYKGMLEGYKSPKQVKSVLNSVVTKIWNNTDVKPNDGLVTGKALDDKEFLNASVSKLLSGESNQVIGQEALTQIANQLSNGISSPIYEAANGAKYHYVYWLEGDINRVGEFVNDNKDTKYGQPLTAKYSATVVVDAEPGVQEVTSPISIRVSKVWNEVGGKQVALTNPLKAGEQLTEGIDQSLINTNSVKQLLTGAQGTNISTATLAKLKENLPQNITGTADYKTADGNHYYYDFWLDSVDSNNTKYGEPVTVNYTASLKWAKKDMVTSEN